VPGAAGHKLALSNLPERNPFFTGRAQVLTQLQEALAAQGRAALSGLGGVGKTQTVVEYAHRHLEEYAHAFWVTAASREALVSGYVTVAGLLKLSEADAQDQTVAVEAVKRWLSSQQGWLLLLDNADDLGMARSFIPPGRNGHVVLTTRAGAMGAVARRIDIQEMGTEEGALFLLRRAKYIAGSAPFEVATPADHSEAKAIAAQVDGLPLALDQAGAYIEETGCGLAGYLNVYRSHALELLRHRGALTSDHPDPVAATWALSFEIIEHANPAAAELLRFCAFLYSDAIPEEVFREGATKLGPILAPVASNVLAWNDALAEVLKFSLLRRDPTAGMLEIHRLVQAVLKQAMEPDAQRLWAERVVRAVNRAFPHVEFSNWPLCDRLLAQADACVDLINQWGFEFVEAARLLNQAGYYLNERGRYADAEHLYQRALAIREKVLGPEHPDVATSLNNLAMLYKNQGRYAKAEPLYQRALAIREKALGPEHPDVAASLRGLALLYRDQGQYAKAEPLYERALKIWKEALGPEHPDVALGLNGLAGLYKDLGQYAKAEPLYHRALAIREKALGPEHPFLAITLNGLAGLYVRQGQYAKAEALYERALAIHERALGPEHSFVATSLTGLAWLYMHQGRYENARSLYEQGLRIWEKAWGPEHPWVASCLNGLAGLYRDQGRYAEAEPLYARAIAIQEKALDPEDPDVAMSLENYALCLRAMDRSQKAETLEERAKAIRAKTA
jgi:tetratricopeptide (TPR) repeat protein